MTQDIGVEMRCKWHGGATHQVIAAVQPSNTGSPQYAMTSAYYVLGSAAVAPNVRAIAWGFLTTRAA